MSKSRESHNPISGEEIGVHQLSEEERANEAERSLDEYRDTVFFLEESDQKTRERLQRYIDHGKYYDGSADHSAKMIAKKLLEDGSFDTKEWYREKFDAGVHQPASHALYVIRQILDDKEITDMNMRYDDRVA